MDFLNSNKHLFLYGLSFLGLYLMRKYFNGPKTKARRDMSGKIIIVTGSSEGIGKETAITLLKDGATVIFACRDENKTMKIINNLDKKYRENAVFMHLDLSEFKSVLKFKEDFKKRFDRLDILVNNAASVFKTFQRSIDGIEKTLQVNTISPMVLSHLLKDLIHQSKGRVINVASMAYKSYNKEAKFYDKLDINADDSKYSGLSTYCFTKLGNVYFTQELAEHCKENNLNILTASLHPGVIGTEIFRDYKGLIWSIIKIVIKPIFSLFAKNIEMGSQTTLHLCYIDDKDFKSGEFYSDCCQAKLLPHATDLEKRKPFIRLAKRCIEKNAEILKTI
jgi:retinol dehydrogenase-12